MTFLSSLVTLFGLFLPACVTLLLLGGGLLFLGLSIWALRNEFARSRQGLIVPGMVTAIETRRERGRKGKVTVHRSVVTFQSADFANPVTVVSPVGSSWRFHRVGQAVQVIYLPADLQSARIDDFTRWLGPCLGIGFSLVFVTLTLLLSSSMFTIRW